MDRLGPIADWRQAGAYAPLLEADRSVFAWEWLRRNPVYREVAGADRSNGSSGDAARWGLHRLEDPSRGAFEARPIWRAADHPHVLRARARAATSEADAVDLSHLQGVVDKGRLGEHWLLSDGFHTIRLDLAGRSGSGGPVELCYLLAGRAAVRSPLLVLRRLLAFADTGRLSKSLHPPERRARRWILALRAFDAVAAGARQRDIAALLLSDAAAEARWRIRAASVRSQVQRLTRWARQLAGDGYRSFLS